MKGFDFIAFFLGVFVTMLLVMLLRLSVSGLGPQPLVAAIGAVCLVMVALNVRVLRARGKAPDAR